MWVREEEEEGEAVLGLPCGEGVLEGVEADREIMV